MSPELTEQSRQADWRHKNGGEVLPGRGAGDPEAGRTAGEGGGADEQVRMLDTPAPEHRAQTRAGRAVS